MDETEQATESIHAEAGLEVVEVDAAAEAAKEASSATFELVNFFSSYVLWILSSPAPSLS